MKLFFHPAVRNSQFFGNHSQSQGKTGKLSVKNWLLTQPNLRKVLDKSFQSEFTTRLHYLQPLTDGIGKLVSLT